MKKSLDKTTDIDIDKAIKECERRYNKMEKTIKEKYGKFFKPKMISWVLSRPLKVQQVIMEYPPHLVYKLKETGQIGTIYSYEENKDKTITVKFDTPDRFSGLITRVMGIDPKDLMVVKKISEIKEYNGLLDRIVERNIADALITKDIKKIRGKDKFTTKTIEKLLEVARKHRIEPLRFKSKDVIEINSGILKGFRIVKKNVRPDGRGKEKFYQFIVNKQAFKKLQNDKNYIALKNCS